VYSIRPQNEGPWLTILTTLFPADNYLVNTQIETYSDRDATKGLPDLVSPNILTRLLAFDTGYEFPKTVLNQQYWLAATDPLGVGEEDERFASLVSFLGK